MNNFQYLSPTRVVFGKGSIAELATLMPEDARVLMTYGGGSIKRNGVYDQVKAALGGRDVIEFGGIEVNPVYETLMQAAGVCRTEGVDFLLPVGGGSVLDGTKFISVAACYDDDPWVFLAKRGIVMPRKAIPLGVVLTLPATGSETNPLAVISRKSIDEKRAFESELMYPRFAILDPETTFSLPRKQVRNGIVDVFVHVVEQYMTYPSDAPLQDRQAEAVWQTLIEIAETALSDPTNYEARANLMWCATIGLNRILACGVPQDWATHLIGHELTAFYGVAHAESLAIVLPALWQRRREQKAEKLIQYGRRVWGIDTADRDGAIDQAIGRTVEFFNSLGMPTSMAAYDIDPEDAAAKVQARFEERGFALGEHKDIDGREAAAILRMCG